MTEKPQSDEPQTDEPKIHVDEDWKSQVQAEKEALARGRAGNESQQQPSTSGSSSQGRSPSPFPPPSLASLITMLGTQAMIALGQASDPATGRAEAHPDLAKYLIDTLAVLEEKTAGNRTPEEIALLSNLLHELRTTYIAITSGPKPQAQQQPKGP